MGSSGVLCLPIVHSRLRVSPAAPVARIITWAPSAGVAVNCCRGVVSGLQTVSPNRPPPAPQPSTGTFEALSRVCLETVAAVAHSQSNRRKGGIRPYSWSSSCPTATSHTGHIEAVGRWGLTGGMMFERTCGCHDSDSDLQTTIEALKANGHRGAPYLPRLSDVRPLRVQRQGHRCKCNLAIIFFGLQQSPNARRPDYSVEGGRAELTGGGNASVHGSRTTHCSHPHQN